MQLSFSQIRLIASSYPIIFHYRTLTSRKNRPVTDFTLHINLCTLSSTARREGTRWRARPEEEDGSDVDEELDEEEDVDIE